MRAIWRIYTQFTRGIRARKILHALSYVHQLHANTVRILLKDESFVVHTREVRVFLYGGNRVCIHGQNITLSGAGFAQRVVKAIKIYFQMRVIFAWKLDVC